MSIKELHGVSVVICCYNSADRLPATLEHLMRQEVDSGLPWEVIVVDNASTDDTGKLAKALWPEPTPVPLHVVREPEPGLSYARKRGLDQARYELVSFIDDDNWVAPDWVEKVHETMKFHPEVGACGGRTEAVFEAAPPFWFERFKNNFVIGQQAEHAGDITWSSGHLWGAGLTVRKAALQELINNDFKHLLTGRKKTSLTSGEDYEICYALRMAGWKLWYEPSLVLRHYMPQKRLTWENLMKMYRGLGATTIGLDPYLVDVRYTSRSMKKFLGRLWLWQLFGSLYILIWRRRKAWASILWKGFRENTELPIVEYEIGRITALCRHRDKYDTDIQEVKSSRWRKLDESTVRFFAENINLQQQTSCCLSSKPLVTALICNYNYSRFLTQAIDSALSQTWKPLEVLVVDDGSTDDSRTVLRQYGDRIRVIFKENGGQASAFNAGIKEARGEIICFLDSDDFWYPEKVERTVAKYREAPWGLVCNDLQEVNEAGMDICNQTHAQATNVTLKSGYLLDFIIEQGSAWAFSPTSGMSLPKEIAEKLWPLPEEEWHICADSPLAYGALCHGPAGIINEPLGAYRVHDVNNFTSRKRDKVAYRLEDFIVLTKRYLFLKDYIERIAHRPLKKDLKDVYPFFHSWCFISKNQPWRDLIKLWKLNLYHHLIHRKVVNNPLYKTARFLLVDTLLTVLISFRLPSPYKELRKRYRQRIRVLSPSTLSYLKESMIP